MWTALFTFALAAFVALSAAALLAGAEPGWRGRRWGGRGPHGNPG
ncbi:MAG: hypothetical protein WBW74_28390 [Xanthobacteraceae bacterium]